MPAVWSSIVASPFVAFGLAGHTGTLSTAVPNQIAATALTVGVGIFLIGCYVHVVGADEFRTGTFENHIESDHPVTPFARAKSVVGLFFLALAAYWLFYTRVPYVYPTVSLFAGGSLFTTGLWTYWKNTLTSYHLTDEQLVIETRFLGSNTNRLPLQKVKSLRTHRPFYLRLFGLGNITLDVGDRQHYLVRHLRKIDRFADELNQMVIEENSQ